MNTPCPKRPSEFRKRPSSVRYPRRGVTLLLVLGLMSMFALLVVTFMTVTTQARRAAESAARLGQLAGTEQSLTTAAKDTDLALQKLLVGDNLESVIGPWSILENMYGNPVDSTGDLLGGIFGAVSWGAAADNEDAFWTFTNTAFSFGHTNFGSTNPAPLDLAGSILTITVLPPNPTNDQRELLHKSTRIYRIDGGAGKVLIVPFDGFEDPINYSNPSTFLNNCTYVINGAPFSGTGPGFDPTASPLLTGEDGDSTLFALRPNILAPSNSPTYKEYLQNSSPFPAPVLMNPDYTAPDYLNMFLAWVDLAPGSSTNIQRVIPSFHRPDLIGSTPLSLDDARKVVLRPLIDDHPNFTGSNPLATDLGTGGNIHTNYQTFLNNGPWDVDSDNDGVPDSVWIDAGLGTYVDTRTNKTYKKLVAYHVQDMDGRLNVNVHGNITHINDPTNTNLQFDPDNSFGTGVQGSIDVRGSGSGPAEVRLDKGLAWINPSFNLRNLLWGRTVVTASTTASTTAGRYSKISNVGDDTTSLADLPFPFPQSQEPQASYNWTDVLTDGYYQKMGVNPLAYDYLLTPSAPSFGVGGISPDWWGQSAVHFDLLGNRTYQVLSAFLPLGDRYYEGNPYLFDPYRFGGDDSPFLAEQMMAIFQTPGDVDFGFLQPRTRDLIDTTPLTQASLFRHHLTPMSSDIPSPSRFLGTDGTNVDWSIYRKVWRIFDGDPNQATKAAELLYLLPEEIRQGLRVNLNRPTLSQYWVNDPTGPNYLANHKQGLLERAKFAQEIFYLLLVLNYDELFTSPGYVAEMTQQEAIMRLAQWSVNLVDFMDPDATMTPFIFSVDPFSGTKVFDNCYETESVSILPDSDEESMMENGIPALLDSPTPNGSTPPAFVLPSPPIYLIWGMEKPEVAITETLGTHNRCVADTNIGPVGADGSNVGTGQINCNNCSTSLNRKSPTNCAGHNNGTAHDQDFDQMRAPEPSLFIELYRQGNPNRSRLSPELTVVGDEQNLHLDRQTSNGDYVWRVAISEPAQTTQTRISTNKDLLIDGENCAFQPQQWPGSVSENQFLLGDRTIQLERFVWFGPSPTSLPAGVDPAYSYGMTAGNGTTLEPNEYLVIGPRVTTSFLSQPVSGAPFNNRPALIARFNQHDGDPDTQIVLSNLTPTDGKNAKWLVAEASGGLGVNISPGIKTPYSIGDPSLILDTGALQDFGTIACARSVFLQRLADPSRDHDPITNPYITVDWSMADLHIFTSEQDTDAGSSTGGGSEASDLATQPVADRQLKFGTRQWGVTGALAGTGMPNIWDRNMDPATTATTDRFAGLNGTNNSSKLDSTATIGELNQYNGVTATDHTTAYGAIYKGAPDTNHPFVHFAWNDAPFANTLEVMQVPACSASTFGIQVHDAGSPTPQSLGTGQRFRNLTSGLGYLLSFEAPGLNLARFLEQVHVPSRFAGTIVDWIPESGDPVTAPPYSPPRPIYTYREPGKINLNTVTESAWEGLAGNRSGFPNYSPDWMSIRGANFENPLRSINAVSLIPDGTPASPIEATLLRKDATGLLFKNEPDSSGSSPPANMYTTYENVARLSSMTTNRSNVFAVWVTVGYFEVKQYSGPSRAANLLSDYPDMTHIPGTSPNRENYFDAVYPDGYVLGKEKGIDDGTVKRHRAFYLIDRTIPVGFRRGETLNSKDVIIYSRVLE